MNGPFAESLRGRASKATARKTRRQESREIDAPTPSCPWCGETFEGWVDEGAGAHQRYVEDCAVCCHPCVVTIEPGAEIDDEARVSVERE